MHSMAPPGLIWVAPLALVGVHSSQGAKQHWHLRATLHLPGAQVSYLLCFCLLDCCALSCCLLGCCLSCCPVCCCRVGCCPSGVLLWVMHALTYWHCGTCSECLTLVTMACLLLHCPASGMLVDNFGRCFSMLLWTLRFCPVMYMVARW